MVNNVTGWAQLLNGSFISSINVLYTYYWGDWFVTILFIGFKFMLYYAVDGNPLTMFVSSILFLALFKSLLSPLILGSVVSVAIIELAMLLFSIIYK